MATFIKEDKEKEEVIKQATTLYELLNINRNEFIKEEEIGAMHEKQMQMLYNDFKNSCISR